MGDGTIRRLEEPIELSPGRESPGRKRPVFRTQIIWDMPRRFIHSGGFLRRLGICKKKKEEESGGTMAFIHYALNGMQ